MKTILEKLKGHGIGTFLYSLSNVLHDSAFRLFPQNFLVVKGCFSSRFGRLCKNNWGDDMNYALLGMISGRRIILSDYSLVIPRNMLNYACIGSIVEWGIDGNSVVWGSGAMYGGSYPLKVKPRQVLAVRGPLTRDYLLQKGVDCPAVYGDPALLLPRFYKPEVRKKYRMGIIPHICDRRNPFLLDFVDKNPDTLVIDMRHYKHWTQVPDQVCQCEFIISSSLHGLIVADAYGVPNVWVEFSDMVEGKGFKFRDYFASVGRSGDEPYRITEPLDYKKIRLLAGKWEKPRIDLELLWNACPFKKNK